MINSKIITLNKKKKYYSKNIQSKQIMQEFLQRIRTHFNVIHKDDYLSLTLINPNLDLDIITQIKDTFRLMHHIKKQQIIIIQSVTFDDQLLQTLADALPQSLQELSLDFTGCQSLRGDGFLHLFQKLSQMNLRKLKLDLSQVYDVNDIVIEGLTLLLENLQDLQEFYLDFYEVDQITQDGYLLLAQSFSSLTNLKYLHLDFCANPNLTQDALQLLFTNLIPQKLKQFTFRILDIDHIGGGSFFKLGETLSKMSQLQILNLTISTFSNLNNKGVYSIIKQITYLLKLKQLTLNLSNISLPEKILNYLNLPPSVQVFNLDVSCNKQLGDGDVLNLIKNVKFLFKFTLNLDFCYKITDDSLEEIIGILLKNSKCTQICLPDRKYSCQLIQFIMKNSLENQRFIKFQTAEINQQIKQEYQKYQGFLSKKRNNISIIRQCQESNKTYSQITDILAIMN